jgi:hypothetical protein
MQNQRLKEALNSKVNSNEFEPPRSPYGNGSPHTFLFSRGPIYQ